MCVAFVRSLSTAASASDCCCALSFIIGKISHRIHPLLFHRSSSTTPTTGVRVRLLRHTGVQGTQVSNWWSVERDSRERKKKGMLMTTMTSSGKKKRLLKKKEHARSRSKGDGGRVSARGGPLPLPIKAARSLASSLPFGGEHERRLMTMREIGKEEREEQSLDQGGREEDKSTHTFFSSLSSAPFFLSFRDLLNRELRAPSLGPRFPNTTFLIARESLLHAILREGRRKREDSKNVSLYLDLDLSFSLPADFSFAHFHLPPSVLDSSILFPPGPRATASSSSTPTR